LKYIICKFVFQPAMTLK